MTKRGYELYGINIVFGKNISENELDAVLAKLCYETNIKNLTNNEAEVEIKMSCTWYHKDAYWDDNGGGPAEDDIRYSGIAPDDIEFYLKKRLNAEYVSIEYKDFVED